MYSFILLQTLILCERMNEWTLHNTLYILHMHIAFLVFILILHRFQNNYGHGVSSTNTKEKKARRNWQLLGENRELGVEEWCFSKKNLSCSCELPHVVPFILVFCKCSWWHYGHFATFGIVTNSNNNCFKWVPYPPCHFMLHFLLDVLQLHFVVALHNKVYELPHVVPLHLYSLWV